MGCAISIYLYLYVQLMGKRMVCGGLRFTGTVCPVPDIGNIYHYEMDNILATVSIFDHIPRMFMCTDFLFEKNGLE